MTRIIVKTLLWDDWNREHIRKHKVSIEEVEVVAKNIIWHKRTHNMRYLATGRSGTRIVSIIIRRKEKTTYYLVTARDANKEERKKLYEREI